MLRLALILQALQLVPAHTQPTSDQHQLSVRQPSLDNMTVTQTPHQHIAPQAHTRLSKQPATSAADQQMLPSPMLLHQQADTDPVTQQQAPTSSEALADAADQPLSCNHGHTAAGSTPLSPEEPPSQALAAAQDTASEPQPGIANLSAVTASLGAPVGKEQPLHSGFFTQLLQDAHDTDVDQEAAPMFCGNNCSAAEAPATHEHDLLHPQSPACQQQDQHSQKCAIDQHQVMRPQQQKPLLSPAQALHASFARPQPPSDRPSHKRSHSHKSNKHHKAHKKRAKLDSATRIQQDFLYWHWQTLGDVLQDLNINDIIFTGKPMQRSRRAPSATGPSRPASLLEQYVDTRPLQHLPLLQQPNHPPCLYQPGPTAQLPHLADRLASPTAQPLLVPWQPPAQLGQQYHALVPQQGSTQPPKQYHSSSFGPELPTQTRSTHRDAARQAPDSELPQLGLDCAAPFIGAPGTASAAQAPAADDLALSIPQLPGHTTPLNRQGSPSNPVHTSQLGHSSLKSGGSPENAVSTHPQLPGYSMQRALNRLFRSTTGQDTSCADQLPNMPQVESKQASQDVTTGHGPCISAEPRLAYVPSTQAGPYSLCGPAQHHQQPAILCLCSAPQPASGPAPITPAAHVEDTAHTALPSSQLQPPCPQLQQLEHQQQTCEFSQAGVQPAVLQSAALPSQHILQTLPLPLPAYASSPQLQAACTNPQQLGMQSQCLKIEVVSQQDSPASSSPVARVAVVLPNSSHPYGSTEGTTWQEASSGSGWTALTTASPQHAVVLCSQSTCSFPSSASLAGPAELPPCSPERGARASPVFCHSPVVLWNSPHSSAASVPMLQQGREDRPPSPSRANSLSQQFTLHKLPLQQDLAFPLYTRQHFPALLHLLALPGRPSLTPTIQDPPDSFPDAEVALPLSNNSPRQTDLLPLPAASAREAHERGPSPQPYALDDIAFSAKRVLNSLAMAIGASDSQPLEACDKVLPLLHPALATTESAPPFTAI